MPKPGKKPKARARKTPSETVTLPPRPLYTLLPWACQHYDDRSELKAYVPASGVWECVAEVRRTAGASAETMADYLMRIVNDHEKMSDLLRDAAEALDLCLQSDGLAWDAEREAEITARRIRERV
jgi:hypothetical protein